MSFLSVGSSCTQKVDMPRTGPDGRVWSDDGYYYLVGNQWVLAQSGSSSTSNQQHQSSQQGSYGQYGLGTPLGTTSASNAAAALNEFPQSSISSYQQQRQLVFGSNRQTPGRAAVPRITLDANFRAGASRNMMIWGFVQAMDKMANGQI